MSFDDKFRGIFDATFSFIGFLSPDGILLEANNTAVDVAGIRHEDVIGKYFWDCYWWQSSAAEQERLRSCIALAAQGHSSTYEAEVLVKNGARTTILFSLRPVKNSLGEVTFIIPEGCPIQDLVDTRVRLNAVVEAVNVGTWEWRLQDEKIVVDQLWAEMLGYSPDELEPMHHEKWLAMIHPEDKEKARLELASCSGHIANAFEVKYRARHKSGRWVWMLDKGKLFDLDKDGLFEVMIGARQDISDIVASKEKLRVVEQTFSNSFYHSGIGMALVAPDGAWLQVNRQLCDMLGYSEQEILSLTFQEITHHDDLSTDMELLQETIDGKRDNYQMEKRYWHKKGHIINIILSVAAVRNTDGSVLYFVSQIVDITDRKRSEQIKNEFISTVSHELRTPLTSVSGALGLVLGGSLGDDPELTKQLLSTAYRNSQRLTDLINDLLDIEKIAAGKLHFDMHVQSIGAIIEQAIEENKLYGASRGVNIEFSGKLPQQQVHVDQHRLKQVLANLLSNGIKFSPDDGTVTVTTQIDGDHVIVCVTDRGCGIPEDFKHKIFEKFSQADSSDARQRDGTGLGLAISRQLIEHMQGCMSFESTEGQGSRFYFQLPLVRVAEKISNKQAANNSVTADYLPKVLVVEDEPDVASLLKTMLEFAGCLVDICYDGKQALEALQTQSYDLISLDLMLPDMSGLDIIRRIREQANTSNIPIVVVSAKMEQGKIALNGQVDGVEWLAKPIDQEKLIALVKRKLLVHAHPNILHVENDLDLHSVIKLMVAEHMALDNAPTLEKARVLLAQHAYDAVLLDIGLPDGNGLDLLSEIKDAQPNAAIFVLTGEDVSSKKINKIHGVLMKSRITPEHLIEMITNRIRQNTHHKDVKNVILGAQDELSSLLY